VRMQEGSMRIDHHRMKAVEVELAVANLFGIRRNVIIPNASWGMGLHECDLLIIRDTGNAVEVEIKVSKADLKKDAEKRHGHISNRIKQLYFAVPDYLAEACIEYAPQRAGVITVERWDGWPFVKATFRRPAVTNKDSRAFTQDEIRKASHLAAMRVWGLKEKLIALHRKVDKNGDYEAADEQYINDLFTQKEPLTLF
jgi:hypothetical protein